jgi:hypothetical protein
VDAMAAWIVANVELLGVPELAFIAFESSSEQTTGEGAMLSSTPKLTERRGVGGEGRAPSICSTVSLLSLLDILPSGRLLSS